jgi:hypothetical protein
MGGQSSKPAEPSPPQPPSLTPAAQCTLHQVELNQLNNDLRKKQEQVDNCNPQQTQTRRTNTFMEANIKFIEEQRNRLNSAINNVQKNIQINSDLREAIKPLKTIETQLLEEKKKLEELNRELLQGQRKQRRNFMDNDPQSSIGGIPGVRTTDDKVMLAFWITVGVGTITAYLAILNILNISLDTNKKMYGVGILIFVYGLGYYLITHYA